MCDYTSTSPELLQAEVGSGWWPGGSRQKVGCAELAGPARCTRRDAEEQAEEESEEETECAGT